MKIIAHTEIDSDRHPRKLLVEVSVAELEKLSGTTQNYRHETPFKIGKELTLDKVWNFNWKFRTLFRDRLMMVEKLRSVLSDIESMELPSLEVTKES